MVTENPFGGGSTSRSSRHDVLRSFEALPLGEKLARVIAEANKPPGVSRSKSLRVLEQERLTIRHALLFPQERGRLLVFAVVPLVNRQLVVGPSEAETLQYEVDMVVPGRYEVFRSSRTSIAKDPYRDGYATVEELKVWDQAIREGATLIEEGKDGTYRRRIEEIKTVDARIKRGEISPEGAARKLPLIVDYFVALNTMVDHLTAEGYSGEFGELFTVDFGKTVATLHMHSVKNERMRKILLGKPTARVYARVENPVDTTLEYDDLWTKKLAFDAGNKSAENRAADQICKMFDIKV